MNKEYNKRKSAELIKLQTIINSDKSIKDKHEFVKKLRQRKINKELHELTRIDYRKIKNFDYSYMRFDGIIKNLNFEKTFYKGSNYFEKSNSIFTNCGMSAISSLLMSLLCPQDYFIEIKDDCYFETYRLCSVFNHRFNSKNRVLYMDTIEDNFVLDIPDNINDYKIVIIDTTCFLPDQFKNLLKKLSKKNVLTILVRSHTKLDLLGTEYAHIGSATYLYNQDHDNLVEDIIKNQKLFLGIYGSFLNPINYTDMLLDSEIKNLNKKRINIIRKNSRKLYDLSAKRYCLPNHELFCTYRIKLYNTSLIEIRNQLKKFFADDKKIYYSVSFALDFMAVDVYSSAREDEYIFRISPGDYPLSFIEKMYKKINEFTEMVRDKYKS